MLIGDTMDLAGFLEKMFGIFLSLFSPLRKRRPSNDINIKQVSKGDNTTQIGIVNNYDKKGDDSGKH